MLKTFKKLSFAFVLCFVVVLLFACDDGANKECTEDDCKDFINECVYNEETCAEFIEECEEPEECEECKYDEDTCSDFITVCPPQNFVAPTSISIFEDPVTVGTPYTLDIEDIKPKGAYDKLYWFSSDETIATVDGNGQVTGLRPGEVEITAVSVLNEEVSYTATITVRDNLTVATDILSRELTAFVQALPAIATGTFEFPTAWNPAVTFTVKDADANVLENFSYTSATGDKRFALTIVASYNGESMDASAVIWGVSNLQVNSVVRVTQAMAAVDTLLKAYTADKVLLTKDLYLPLSMYGVDLTWTSSNTTVLSNAGVYTRPLDDKGIKLDATFKNEDYGTSAAYNFTAKGYNADEKVEYILTKGSLATFNGASFNTNLVLPAVDKTFKAKLSYTSSDQAVITNAGEYKAPTTDTDVTITVEIDYAISSAANNFKKTATFTVKALAATDASAAANDWLAKSAYKQIVNFPWGKVEGNVLDVPTTYTHGGKDYSITWSSNASELARVSGEQYKLFDTTGAKPKLVAQYLRYTEARLVGTFKGADGKTADVNLLLNVGVQTDPYTVLACTWRGSAQKDTALTPVQGKYDIVGNVSYFDLKVGCVTETFGSGYWSGYVFTSNYNGGTYQCFVMEQMTVYIREDANGKLYIDAANVNSGTGGNWGVFFVNTTNKVAKLEVGTYASGNFALDPDAEEGTEPTAVVGGGTREHALTMDGYAAGFVADKDGNVIYGSQNVAGLQRFQNDIPNKTATVGDTSVENLLAVTIAGQVINYVEVPANGYAMSWKYQFYGVGTQLLDEFCANDKLTIEKYQVHPLSSQYAETAAVKLVEAQTALNAAAAKEDSEAVKEIEAISTLLKTVDANYAKLTGDTKADVYDLADVVKAQKDLAKLVDKKIALVLAGEKPDAAEQTAEFLDDLNALKVTLDGVSAAVLANSTEYEKYQFAYYTYIATGLKFTVTLDYYGGFAVDAEGNPTEDTTGTVEYAPADESVPLPEAAYRVGYIFCGWYKDEAFTTKAVITGTTFANITVYAKWDFDYAYAVAQELELADYTVLYYPTGASTGSPSSALGAGTYFTQMAETGIGTRAIVVGNNIFLIGYSALIDLGANMTADTVFDKKNEKDYPGNVQVLGTDGTTQLSCGLQYNPTTKAVTIRNSYGYGALYYNSSEFNATVTIELTYGRNLGGYGYGYQRYLMEPQTDGTYKLSMYLATAGATVVLKPGDYFWCPATGDRYGSGFTDSSGASGKQGVLHQPDTSNLITFYAKIVDLTKLNK